MGLLGGDAGQTSLDCHGVHLVDVLSLVFRLEGSNYFLDHVLVGVGVVAGEHQTGCSFHGGLLFLHFVVVESLVAWLGRHGHCQADHQHESDHSIGHYLIIICYACVIIG